ncbi:protein fem-1 homolog C isoform X2 [Onthophagus taurus]|uniref:protein fem-1 homolog C isoform X2 n=1 Tax=Onthophagus taurus TaxID=166361 RepID=UPI000C205DCB|nr:protein fem-1 homolog CG6966 isoform X2 [Onthophagus taurus]
MWKSHNKVDVVSQKDDCFQDLIEECKGLPPGSKLSYSLRSRLEKFSLAVRKEIVNRVKIGNAPLFIACKKGQLEIVEYLVNSCGADIEQGGCYEVPDDRSVHSVTPLWCAAVSGKLPVVQFLVDHGANLNAVSDSGSTPVRSACFMTHLEIVQYLVEKGADINRPNYNGGTCLINSVQSAQLCSFLLKHGADVNARDIQNKTALHYAIQEHRIETTALLLEHGANYNVKSKYGDDALQTACLKGAVPIFDYLISHIWYSNERLANAHELLGSTFLDEHNDLYSAIKHWKIAQTIRETPQGIIPKLPIMQPREAFRYQREFSTMEELENLMADLDSIRIQSLLIAERILGPNHKDNVFRLMFRGASYADMMCYQRCIDLWRRALEVRVEKDSILYSDTCFTAQALVRFMVDYNEKHIPSDDTESTYIQRFEDSVATYRILTNEIGDMRQLLNVRPQYQRQLDNFDKILKCITHLIYLMLQTAKTQEQCQLVVDLVTKLIQINPRCATTDETLLHLCVSKLNTIRSGYFSDEQPVIIFPEKQVIQFLLNLGANPNATNDSKSTPLHVATMPHNVNNWLVPLLLEYGAHIDLPNVAGTCPVDRVNVEPFNLDIRILNFISLKCLCVKTMTKYKIPYRYQLPKTLELFVHAHNSSRC